MAAVFSRFLGDVDGFHIVLDSNRPATFESIVLNILNRSKVDLDGLKLVVSGQHLEHGMGAMVLDFASSTWRLDDGSASS